MGFSALLTIAVGAFSCAGAQTDGGAQEAVVREPVRQSFDMQAPLAPAPLRTGGRRELIYELHLTNFARDGLTLSRVQVLNTATGAVVHDLTGESLRASVGVPGAAPGDGGRTVLESGRRAIVYLSVPVPTGFALQSVRHRVEAEVTSPSGPERFSVSGAETPVDDRAPPVLGPPLRGGPWTAVYDPALVRGHRRVVYAVGGRARIPGRHAIDWMAAGPSDRGEVANPWAGSGGFGAEVLAVADATVVAARDGVSEPVDGAERPPVTLANATGNYIALDLGRGRYAFYEHLAPSLAVKMGQRVRRGQVIARLGSTGQASRPHLHFHVSDANSPLGAEGLPYELSGWRAIGSYASIDAFNEGARWRGKAKGGGSPAGFALPPPMSVVVFE